MMVIHATDESEKADEPTPRAAGVTLRRVPAATDVKSSGKCRGRARR
jgi:hypothetical protein